KRNATFAAALAAAVCTGRKGTRTAVAKPAGPATPITAKAANPRRPGFKYSVMSYAPPHPVLARPRRWGHVVGKARLIMAHKGRKFGCAVQRWIVGTNASRIIVWLVRAGAASVR